MSSKPKPEQSASMLGGHASYAKGYVEETIGNLTGSKDWQASGKEDAKAGIEEMKRPLRRYSWHRKLRRISTLEIDNAALQTANAQKKNDPAPTSLGGRVEEMAGKATGCEGMEAEGKERQEKAE
ncbi:MAG: hypothetical protein M1818_004314 [Claussenomyces sp. TS43310]|nr:MAG: hypothetical protein M1818_004314 [Claussenomyces sp. TS43310]